MANDKDNDDFSLGAMKKNKQKDMMKIVRRKRVMMMEIG